MNKIALWRRRLRNLVAIYGQRPLQIAQIQRHIKHISGPLTVEYGPDELIALCLVRDAELYVHSFMKHYAALGVKHIFLLDNGSTDRTLDLVGHYPNVTIVQTHLPFKKYKMALRHYLIKQFARKNRWALYVDIDELFDYPYSDTVDLAAFLGYLREREYTAVIAYMLDLFSDEPLNQLKSGIDDDLRQKCRYYDLSDVLKMDYYFPRNQLPTDEIKGYFGGIRRLLFAPEELRFVLTKHPLFFLDGQLKPLFVDEHFVRDGKVADVTAVLYHYKFLADFAQRTLRAVQEENYHTNSEDYKKYLNILKQNPDMVIKQPTSRELHDIDQLIAAQFLYVSPAFTQWAAQQKGKTNG